PKTWAVLQYLVNRAGVLVTKDDLLDAVWTDTSITEAVLNKSIGELRRALGDSVKSPRFIETVQRRGFRFIAPLSPADLESELPAAPLSGGREAVDPTPFVGRDAELQQLATLFAKAQAGERQIVFVTGPAGIGKTALVDAFFSSKSVRESTGPAWIARGLCIEQHGSREAYLPVLEALERLVRRPDGGRVVPLLRRIAPTWLAQIPWLVSQSDGEALRQTLQTVRPERMLREFVALVEALSADVTLVLTFEDLHWSDPSTIDLLSMLAGRREPARLLIIGTFRPADAVIREHVLMNAVRTMRVHRRCVELPLSELSEEGVRSYLEARFPGNRFPVELARQVYEYTEGHPLFLIAIVNHILSRGLILDTSPGWALSTPLEASDLTIPEDVRLMIEEEVDALSPADRSFLQAASVAGSDFTALVVAAALNCETADAETRCETFVRARRFLRVAGHVEWPDRSVARRYAFIHELYRQVVYAEIPEGHCMRLHQRVGQALEAAYGARPMEIAPQLAIHFERSRDDARALQYLIVAAAGARQRFANREVIAYLEAALALVAHLPDEEERNRRELEVRLALGSPLSDIHGFGSEPVRANQQRSEELCKATGSIGQHFELLYARAHFHVLRAERDETNATLVEVEELAKRSGVAEHRFLASCAMMRCAVWEGRFTEAIHFMRHRIDRPRLQGVDSAIAYGQDPWIESTSLAAIALWFLGYPERARETVHAALAHARGSGHLFTIALVLAQASLVELLCRNVAACAALAEEAISLSAEHGFPYWKAGASMLRGWASIQLGRTREGNEEIEESLAAMHGGGMRLISPIGCAFLAEGRTRTGALADGLAAVDAGLAMTQTSLDRCYEPELWRLKGEIFLAAGKAETRRSPRGKRAAAPGASAGSSWEEAEGCLLRALELARLAEARSLELRAATSLARAWQERGRSAEAARLLGGVCDWFGSHAHGADVVEARTLLAEIKP
ncbi:MAG TPA: AAA family ATPase, partial [Stellaceae bacterium]|nr:AAA family ATPase [Stellaceae bacterium]